MVTKYIFAVNPRQRDAAGNITEQCKSLNNAWSTTAEQILSMLKRGDVAKTVESLRQDYNEDVKKWQLPYICPHYSAFNNNHRAQNDIIASAFTFVTCIDEDDPEKAPIAIERALALNQDEMSQWKDSVLYIEYSTRKPKCHIWIRMPKGKTIEESQRMFCNDLGDDLNAEPDPQCFTPERLILMTGDEVYRSDRWLQPLTDEEIEERREAFLMRGLDVDGRPLKKPETVSPAPTAQVQNATTEIVAANDRTRFIVQECLKEAGLTVNDLNVEGGRHNSVKSILSVGVTQLLKKEEFMGVLQEISPNYSKEKECQQLVADFYNKYSDNSAKLTQFQRQVFAASRKVCPVKMAVQGDAQEAETSVVIYGDTASLADIYSSPVPPRLSKSATPRFVKIATGPVPEMSKETAAQAMFPPLGMYCDASFTYTDNTPREPRGNCLIIAGTGGGKDSTTKHMLKHLEAPQRQEDGPNRVQLEKYKREYNRKNQNEDKPERPNVAVKSVASDITKARLAELMSDSQGNIIHVRMIEFDQWFGVEGWKPGPNCPFTYLKMTDDEDNPFGQERVGSQSITYQGPLSINWNSSTTLNKAIYYFRNNMVDGPISRLTLATVPYLGLGSSAPVHGKYDAKYDAALKPFIDNLSQAHGEIYCTQARRMANRLKAELDDFVVKSGDEVLDNLGHRALVAAFRKACILYAANGLKWEKSIEGFCRFSLHYDLWLKLHFFGDLIRHADSQVKTSRRGPANMLSQISTKEDGTFTYQDAVLMRAKNGKEEEGTSGMLNQWVSRGLIERLGNGIFRKIDKADDK